TARPGSVWTFAPQHLPGNALVEFLHSSIPAFLLRRRLSVAIVLDRVGALHLPKQHEGLQVIRPQRRAEVIDAL
ncbi:MAG TPA: hypothetical protein PLL14_11275, partial [Accumulibacter sp.]|nr:hypothetical protein [Accumulibacter sp.]